MSSKRKRLLDLVGATLGLVVLGPAAGIAALATFWEDRHNPLYVADRIGLGGKPFRLIKLRSMVVNADKSGVASTGVGDKRITKAGGVIRKTKLDEVPQFLNVLRGEMSLVGPRPQVAADVARYTRAERTLLTVRPGITDASSIVFADEGEIIAGSDPEGEYDRRIRPWKSRLGLHYIATSSLKYDLVLMALTGMNPINRRLVLRLLVNQLAERGLDPETLEAASRRVSKPDEGLPPE
ncbi:sugar transferase [Euzebya rosea]|uniref:sugar transferase n=1 Tax=Euzebya rosea TaxID=2052804 RepID=UPI00196AF098|nr:sugar transferase [Euzebya rosea]